mmetsp:Transcript_16194/g.49482  ORF Transcript_16194/g.49482 Transcript_16194/m.49482 type:complete len:200 (+) Transcript_16194:3041-3640(+)
MAKRRMMVKSSPSTSLGLVSTMSCDEMFTVWTSRACTYSKMRLQFSILWMRILGFLLYLRLHTASTDSFPMISSRFSMRMPSLMSSKRSLISRPRSARYELHQRVKVFFCSSTHASRSPPALLRRRCESHGDPDMILKGATAAAVASTKYCWFLRAHRECVAGGPGARRVCSRSMTLASMFSLLAQARSGSARLLVVAA